MPTLSDMNGAKEPVSATEDDLMSVFRKRYEDAYQRERNNIDLMYEDMGFAEGENQWDLRVRRQREAAMRPCLTENRVPSFVRQITGKIRQMRPSIKVVPVDSRGDPETAEVLAGLIRYIENRSRARTVYGRALDAQVICGIGAWRVNTEYSDDQTFNQEIRIAPIEDPIMTLFDPNAILPSRSDAAFCFVPIDMSRREFNRRFPGKDATGYELHSHSAWEGWVAEDYVRVCEYWYKEPTKRRLVLLPDGSVDDLTGKDPKDVAEIERMVAEAQAMGQPVRIEDRDSHKIMRALVSYHEVLEEPEEWAGRYIPIVPVVGEEIRIARKVIRRGVVRLMKDPQRMLNYFISAETEMVALQPKAPFLATEKNIEQYQDLWEQANTENLPYLPYKPDPENGGAAPQRSQPPVSSQGLTEGIIRNVEALKAVTGIYDASLGQRSNETSGRAIEARDSQTETGNVVFVDNFSEALSHTAHIILDLIPHVYDTARTVRIVGKDDDTLETKEINKPNGPEIDGVAPLMNDVTTGAYDVVMKMGPAYDTLRSEAREGITAMIQAGGPEMLAVFGDLLAKMQDYPFADEMAERLEAIAPPAIKALNAEKRGEPPPPPQPSPEEMKLQAEMQMQQAKMQGEQQAKAAELQLRQQEAEADIQLQREKALAEFNLKREIALMEMELEREKFEQKAALDREQALFNAQLKRDTAAENARLKESAQATAARD